MDFFTSPIFFAMLGGFIVLFVYQVVIQGPKDADRQQRVDEYISRLSVDARAQIETLISDGDKIGAIKMFREETNVGLVEAKESIDFMRKT